MNHTRIDLTQKCKTQFCYSRILANVSHEYIFALLEAMLRHDLSTGNLYLNIKNNNFNSF